MEKEYIGDSVYIEQGAWSGEIILTTDNGMGASNTIHLEHVHVDKIKEYADRMREENAKKLKEIKELM